MPTRSFRTTEALDAKIDKLQAAGYGNVTQIVTTAVERLYQREITAAGEPVPALLAELERLRNAIRNARTLDELTHTVGASAEENEAAGRRIAAMDAMYCAHGNDVARWSEAAQSRLARLNAEQDEYERRYC